MVQVDENPDGTVTASSYAIVLSTPRGGHTVVDLSCTCEDLLIRDGDGFQVKRRQVHRDDLPN